ncbi:Glucuronate isomerase [Jonesia denitrificans DSM 20603]|uniref:Uronate isomerase n=2 Tax=Jonesia TaxID=43673 RepID=C7R2P6_JONDD|nr:Glucuronate isomerase [Jonesia denitrificans DSM 20603]SQH22845.1 Uronate isomerase [Jonesia denitrificans]
MQLHPDRLFPADTAVRDIARHLHASIEHLPIISPHGHVDATLLANNTPFPDPTALLISPDHYVTRLLHANRIPLDHLRVGGTTTVTPEETWRTLCANWHLFDGTASGYWLTHELITVFGITDTPNAANADDIYTTITTVINTPQFRPRALMDTFTIEVLATTDDPLDTLEAHDTLANDPTFTPRVIPTFRPDAYTKFWHPTFPELATRLIDEAGDGHTGYDGYLNAIAARRHYFREHGAVSSDHGTHTPATLRLDRDEAARLFTKGINRTATRDEAYAFEAHMLYQQALMSLDDQLVMTLHPGVHRNTHRTTLNTYGPDTGHDIPFAVDYATNLAPLLNAVGTHPDFQLILFTIDETTYSREIAPLAGFYPSIYIGAPWWFLDAPDAMARFRAATTETAGFSRSAGFIDDTRAFCSIPARHDAARRTDAAYLARLVAEHRITETRAHEIIVDLVDAAPRRAFTL